MVEDADGNPVTQDVGPGCTVFVPESRFHSTLNTGTGPMQLFVVYSPAGPELVLRDPAGFPHHSKVRRERSTSMKRIGRVIGLNAADIPEYKRLHAALWPEILALLRKAGMRNYSIFLKEPENLLFAYLEYDGTDIDKDNLLDRRQRRHETLVGPDRPDATTAGHPQTGRMVGRHGRGVSHRLSLPT